MSNFYNVHATDTRQLSRRFRNQEEIESLYEPKYPFSVEREYKRLAGKLQKDFSPYIEPWIIASMTAIANAQPIPEPPAYIAPDYLIPQLEAITTLLMRFSIRQWEISVKRTLGIDINRDYYRAMLDTQMNHWQTEQMQRINERVNEIITDLRSILEDPGTMPDGNAELAKTAEKAKNKALQVQASINQLAISTIGSIYAANMHQMNLDAGNDKYKWVTKGDSQVRPDHKTLDGTIQYWSTPPVTNKKTGDKNAPGEDWGCRCIAQLIFNNPLLVGGLIANAVSGRLARRRA